VPLTNCREDTCWLGQSAARSGDFAATPEALVKIWSRKPPAAIGEEVPLGTGPPQPISSALSS
jgi:hypothetical protein